MIEPLPESVQKIPGLCTAMSLCQPCEGFPLSYYSLFTVFKYSCYLLKPPSFFYYYYYYYLYFMKQSNEVSRPIFFEMLLRLVSLFDETKVMLLVLVANASLKALSLWEGLC